MGAGLSVVAPKAAGRVRAVKVADKAKTAVKAARFIMVSLLLSLETLKAREMDPKEVHQRGANPSIKDLENPEIQAKASDLYRFSVK